MNFFEKLSIKGKFTFILSVSFILLLLAGMISTYKAVKASHSSDTVVNEIIPSVNELGVLTGLFKELRISAIKMPTAKNGDVSAMKEKYAKDYGSITDTVNALNVVFTKEETQTLLKDLSDYDSVVKNELTALCTQGKVPEATAVIRNKLVPIGNSFDKHTATLEKKLEEYSKTVIRKFKLRRKSYSYNCISAACTCFKCFLLYQTFKINHFKNTHSCRSIRQIQ